MGMVCINKLAVDRVLEGFCRIQAKALLLSKGNLEDLVPVVVPLSLCTITVSEVSNPEDSDSRLHSCERRLEQIEAKLDQLLDIQLRSQDAPPPWFAQSSKRLLQEVAAVGGRVRDLSSERCSLVHDNEILREEIGKLAEGADRFLAGLQGKLSQRAVELFWELIYSEMSDDGGRRCRSYSEIGKRLNGVTKQAIENRVKNLRRKHPDVWEYITAIRNPKQAIPYSGLSPSERRKEGIDEAYNYDEG